MIKETTKHHVDGQQITYGEVSGESFRLEVNEINTYGIVSTLRVSKYNAKTDDSTSIITSNIPDRYKLHLADINKRYGTRFLVESQITKGWEWNEEAY